jgi:Mg2+-importing ATPase
MGKILFACGIQLFQDCLRIAAAVKLKPVVLTSVGSLRLEYVESYKCGTIDEKHQVPGDIVYVEQGDKSPVDCSPRSC